MKLRTTFNSIRIRVRKSELKTLDQNGIVEESITFPNGPIMRFSLEVDKNTEVLTAHLVSDKIRLMIPAEAAALWISTDQVGIENHVSLPDDKQLHLLIEKDFPCLDRPEEDKSDTFWELAPDTPEAC